MVSFSSGLYTEAGLKIADGSGFGLLSINSVLRVHDSLVTSSVQVVLSTLKVGCYLGKRHGVNSQCPTSNYEEV